MSNLEINQLHLLLKRVNKKIIVTIVNKGNNS